MNNDWAEAFNPTGDCPPLDDLIAGIEGKRGGDVKLRTQSHLAGCSSCSTELALFQEFESPATRPEEAADVRAIVARLKQNSPVPRPSWWQPLLNWKILAPASMALASAALVLTIWTPAPHRANPDFSGRESVYRSARITVISPSAEVHQSPRVFTWQPVAGAASYRIRVFEVDNTELWTVAVRGPKADLPPAISKLLIGPKAVHWQVTALDSRGAVIGDSGTQTTVIQ